MFQLFSPRVEPAYLSGAPPSSLFELPVGNALS
jgi:hypothetical protein